ncbi:MAG TPA: DUF3467 domain-containing protein [Candidatus Dormibacteraeota bacterium]
MAQQPIQVTVQPGSEQVVFSDVVVLNGGPTGFVLNFGQWAPDQPGLVRVYSRVGLSPNHLKMLWKLLEQNIQGYEAKFGAIPIGDTPEVPHSHIGFEPKT